MPVPPAPAPPQTTAASPARPANGHTTIDKAAETDNDAQGGTPELQTPPKNGKRRRGGRVGFPVLTLLRWLCIVLSCHGCWVKSSNALSGLPGSAPCLKVHQVLCS